MREGRQCLHLPHQPLVQMQGAHCCWHLCKCKRLQCTILKGIPEELAHFASGILTLAQLFTTAVTVDMETLINHIWEEVDRLKNCCT